MIGNYTIYFKKNKMKEFDRLLQIMDELRDPDTGCPWDLVQTESTLVEYLMEETHELIDAIENHNIQNQMEELGDLLLQIVFLAKIHQEKRHFGIKEVLNRIIRKLVERHPHVFSDTRLETPEQVKSSWEQIKRFEKKQDTLISEYPLSTPALLISKKLADQAASAGFDWADSPPEAPAALKALDKLLEEVEELKTAIKLNAAMQPDNAPPAKIAMQEKLAEEIGDILFAVSNISRHLKINPEMALKKTNNKFKLRFRFIETELRKEGKDIQEATLEEMEILWNKAKKKSG
jgi:MazG family protein